jgi:hypothetical protein
MKTQHIEKIYLVEDSEFKDMEYTVQESQARFVIIYLKLLKI